MPNLKEIADFDRKYPDLARRQQQAEAANLQIENEPINDGSDAGAAAVRKRMNDIQDMFIRPGEGEILMKELYPHLYQGRDHVENEWWDDRAKRLGAWTPDHNNTDEDRTGAWREPTVAQQHELNGKLNVATIKRDVATIKKPQPLTPLMPHNFKQIARERLEKIAAKIPDVPLTTGPLIRTAKQRIDQSLQPPAMSLPDDPDPTGAR